MRDEANARRKRPANRVGCKPIEDVCVEHDMPLVCRHGCDEALVHGCKGAHAPAEAAKEEKP